MEKAVNILMVAGHFDLPEDKIPIGGVQKHILEITKELIKRHHSVEWCYYNEAKRLLKNKPNHFNIIIAHDFFSYIDNTNIPQIVVFHGWEGNIPPKPHIIAIRKRVEQKADASICVGDFILEWYGQSPDKVIYGGVNHTDPVKRPFTGNLLYLGRLDPDQSPEYLFHALTLIKHKYHLTVCAEGKLLNQLQSFCTLNNLNVTFKGFVRNVDEEIKNSDIVFCSGYLSILESYINLRPVISIYNNPLKYDYLKMMPYPPFLFWEGDGSIELIKLINDLYNNKYPAQEVLLAERRNFAIENSWSKIVDIYEELIEKCLRKRKKKECIQK